MEIKRQGRNLGKKLEIYITLIGMYIQIALLCLLSNVAFSQIDNTGCIGAGFGVDAGLYSGIVEYGNGTPASGSADWFEGPNGRGTISTENTATLTSLLMAGGNPVYEQRMSDDPQYALTIRTSDVGKSQTRPYRVKVPPITRTSAGTKAADLRA